MSGATHTPGPWVLGWGNGLTGPTTPKDPVVAGLLWGFVPVSRDYETIAIVPNQVSEGDMLTEDKASGEANALLISAAPDLLAVAKRILDRGYVSESIEEERGDHLALVAAIAKAEGRANA